MSPKQISQTFGIKLAYVYDITTKSGLKYKRDKDVLHPKGFITEIILANYKEMTGPEIAKKFGLNYRTVNWILYKTGDRKYVEKPKRKQKSEFFEHIYETPFI
jgi:hypothetical protein